MVQIKTLIRHIELDLIIYYTSTGIEDNTLSGKKI